MNAENRKINAGTTFFTGLVVGVVAHLLGQALIPRNARNIGDYGVILAGYWGLIYAPAVGIWLGWVQRSWERAMWGALVGIAVGCAHMAVCTLENGLVLLVGFPFLLGAVFTLAVGSNRTPWPKTSKRFGRGLLAGFVLGSVYLFIMNICFLQYVTYASVSQRAVYFFMMNYDGPPALGISSALFFMLIPWAVGLTRWKVLVLENNNASNSLTNDPQRV